MEIKNLTIKGPKLIVPDVHHDARGFFIETYQEERFVQAGITEQFVQDNHSYSRAGVIRGLHFQNKPGQSKLVRVLSGEILDVIVDIRQDSETFGQWEGVTLSDKNHAMLYIPKGFAHGFCVLSETAHVVYKVSSFYDQSEEMSLYYADEELGICWPINEPTLSEKDQRAPRLKELFGNRECAQPTG
ncbi:MAG: dTDP-4-dehydrorhamnose 3,5-epimerase [Chlamydiia bacterium]|nr:dTDP-4-dehydrorhamnose 3,5-epimerase [Chlamydiia bacterium]